MYKLLRLLVNVLMFMLGMLVCYQIMINSIRIDGLEEVDKGIVTIEVFGQYYDYEYIP